jgi:hypothetical protein
MKIERISGHASPILAALAGLLILFLGGCGTSANETLEKRATLRIPYRVFVSEVQDGKRVRVLVGYVDKYIDGDDERYHVSDLKRREQGFLLKDLQAFRLVQEMDDEGKHVRTSRALGNRGLEGGVAALLGLASGPIEILDVTKIPPPSFESAGGSSGGTASNTSEAPSPEATAQ